MSQLENRFYFSRAEELKLIDKVRENPALYDPQHGFYKQARTRDNIWREISTHVGRSVVDCKKRWKNMKDTYEKKRKERSPFGLDSEADRKKKRWPLGDKLSFLHSTETNNTEIENISCSVKAEAFLALVDSEDNCFGEEYRDQQSSIDERSGQPEELLYSHVMSSRENPECSENKDRRERLLSLLKQIDKDRNLVIQELLKVDEDEVDLFFKSLAKSVKRLPQSLIIQAKVQTLAVVANLEAQADPNVNRTV